MYRNPTVFEFTSYKFEPDKKRIFFNYKTEFVGQKPLFFTETIILPKVPKIDDIPKELISKLLGSLHIILGISYYKSYCATKVILNYSLSKKEADFWNTVYKNGLGEFFYKNNLNPKISPKFLFRKAVYSKTTKLQNYNRSLVGIGGGKDSIVAAELLKKYKFDATGFVVETGNKSKLISEIIKKIGINDLRIKRILDPKIYDKHQYNGHIPISAIYAFLGILAAVFYKYSYFIVGNEYSSNFGNLRYKGQLVNHQWSKSFEFEKLFQNYIKNFITPDISYFSLLRPFYEIKIVKIFSKIRKYFPVFSSCNSNFKIRATSGGLWCNKCSKCVFGFVLLSAFLSKRELIKIFGKNLYKEESLLPLFKDVLGLGGIKPFDCVGTFEEAQTAMYLASNKFKASFIIRNLLSKLKYYENIFRAQPESGVPEQFKLLGMENVLILGYGKEGKITQKYLKKYYPELKIGIADEKQGKDYLKVQENFDMVIKTPGIPKEKLMVKTRAPITIGARLSTKISKNFSALVPYTTATNIFFSKVKGYNTIIGVTGSKGKSTTSSLIYEIIKAAGKDVILIGNIGKPMLQEVMKPISKNRIFVLEFSSYQLDDIEFSPDIAVVTNLFPEHINYHNGLKNYYLAKKNIINFQNRSNFFVYNPENKEMNKWLKNYKGTPVKFYKNKLENGLIGKHNESNIKAAVAVAKLLHIPNVAIKKAIKNFKGLPHRLEFIGQFKGIKFYDDAISTTPESTIMAIESLPDIDTIFLGGQDRGYNFSKLEKTIKKYKIKNIVLFPESGNRIIKNRKGFNILKTNKMEKAVEFAYKNTKKGKICLLSCASPSYSLWKDFEEKGKQFKYFVKKSKNT